MKIHSFVFITKEQVENSLIRLVATGLALSLPEWLVHSTQIDIITKWQHSPQGPTRYIHDHGRAIVLQQD